MANPDPKNPAPAGPEPRNPAENETAGPSRRERLSAHMHEPSNMGHMWMVVFALFVVAVVSTISFFRVGGLRDDVDSLKATSATKAEVKKSVDDLRAEFAASIAKTEIRLDGRIDDLARSVGAKMSAMDSAVVAAKKSIASVARKAATTSTALDSLTTRVATMFTPDQLKRLKTFADTK